MIGFTQECHLSDINDRRRAIRRGCGDALEQALSPAVSKSERRRLLTFVVVGGGPTGVEFAGGHAFGLRFSMVH